MSLSTNLISYWKFDEASGDALDAHGSHNLVSSGAPSSVAGKVSTARYISQGASERFAVADHADLDPGDNDYTFSAWFALDISTQQTLLSKDDTGLARQYRLDIFANSTRWFVFDSSGGVAGTAQGTWGQSVSTFYHIAFWHDSVNNVVGYAVNNGVRVTSATTAAGGTGTAMFRVGQSPDQMGGAVDELGLWHRVLTSSEITDLYNGGSGLAYEDFFGAGVTATLTGSAVSSIQEQHIVAGGKEIICTLSGDTYVPALSTVVPSFITSVAISSLTTFTTSFIIQLPVTQANDLMLLEYVHRSTSTGNLFGSGGTGTSWTLKHSQMFATSTFSGHLWYRRATGNHSSESVSVSSLVNSVAAHVIVYRGALQSGDPLAAATVVGEQNASGDEQQLGISTDRVSTMVCLTVLQSPDDTTETQSSIAIGALTERSEVLATAGTDTAISHASEVFTGIGDTSTFTWAIAPNVANGSFAYAISPHTTSPFNSARQAFIDGFDSAQSEATGWDAEVKAKASVTEVVRTSDTVVTWTIAAQAGYNITAQETITGTIPASILTGNVSLLATPTFTIDVSSAAADSIRLRFAYAMDGMGVGGVFFGNRIH